jgi:serine/threonine-protein kinase
VTGTSNRFGSYQLLEPIGAGGQGIVHRARDARGCEVALKILRHDLLDEPEARARFEREIALSRTIVHPNVVECYDGGICDGQPFMASRYVRGESLSRRLRACPRLAVPEAVHIVRDCCRGLAAIHAVGLVHRDIKSDNILIENDGRAVITDLGLARSYGSEGTRLTSTGMVVGTPRYMAPEQANGDDQLDGRCDCYALGVVFFRMLCGRLPFLGETITELIRQHQSEAVPDPAQLRPGLDPGLVALLLAMLEKDPARRPSGAAQIERLLAVILSHPPSRSEEQELALATTHLLAAEQIPPTLPDAGQPERAFPGTLPDGPIPLTLPDAPPVTRPQAGNHAAWAGTMSDAPLPPTLPDAQPVASTRYEGDPVAMAWLLSTPGLRGIGHLAVFHGGRLRCGRDAIDRDGIDCCLRLLPSQEHRDANKRLSGQHCIVGLGPLGAWIEDCHSRGGTAVDGRLLSAGGRAELVHGTEVVLAGVLRLLVELLPGERSALLLRRRENRGDLAYLLLPESVGLTQRTGMIDLGDGQGEALGRLRVAGGTLEWMGRGQAPRRIGTFSDGPLATWRLRPLCAEDLK